MQKDLITPDQLATVQVLLRLLLRSILVVVFSFFGGQGFAPTAFAFFAAASLFCVLMGAIRREMPFARSLTHWDEAAAYVMFGCLVLMFGRAH